MTRAFDTANRDNPGKGMVQVGLLNSRLLFQPAYRPNYSHIINKIKAFLGPGRLSGTLRRPGHKTTLLAKRGREGFSSQGCALPAGATLTNITLFYPASDTLVRRCLNVWSTGITVIPLVNGHHGHGRIVIVYGGRPRQSSCQKIESVRSG